uniref:Endonuclease/exonuclease/phosphatase domain-containing protein n=2 Tax=Triticum urartu TaxID=4572 RepID=A0A8R7PBD0_TRIUA
MAPAVAAVPEAGPGAEREAARRSGAGAGTGARPRPKGILKAQASLLSRAPSKARVSINLQDNEISLDRSGRLVGSPRARKPHQVIAGGLDASRRRSVEEVLRETGADIIGLQNVRAEEERGMRPLSELAGALGMRYVFAESWAPEYGNAVLSRWPIKRWKALRVADQSDFRNVLRATIEVPRAGEVNFHCTHLDHLDESWRMKQVDAMLRSVDGPHILAGGLNALDGTDYSADRWADIVKYYEEIGKPTPKVEVMKYLKGKQYVDAKDFAGECEAVVVVAKGQDVQGTCKYGTRVDYILASPNSPYKFVPGSYTVVSSKGTSDHHIVRVDVAIVPDTRDADEQAAGGRKQRVVKMSKKGPRKGIWAAK